MICWIENGSTIDGTVSERQRLLVPRGFAWARPRCERFLALEKVNRWHENRRCNFFVRYRDYRAELHKFMLTRQWCVNLIAEFSFSFAFAVESLIYWRDVKKSGVVFGIGLAVLLAMSMFSLISVFAYLSLLTLVGTISFRIYKTIMSAVQKTSEGHPFK